MTYDKEKIKNLIFTDFLDDQLDEPSKKEVQTAIRQDPELKEFYLHVKKSVKDPFDNASNIKSPDLWVSIEEKIIAQEQPADIFDNIRGFLQDLFKKPRLSYSFMGIAAFIVVFTLAVNITQNSRKPVYDTDQQIEYLILLAGDTQADNGDNGFDTAIEKYFL